MAATESKPDRMVVVEVPGWIRLYDDGSVDRTWTGPPQAHFLTASVPPYDSPRDGISVLDLPADPALRLYLPSAATAHDGSRLPLLLHFHGGGFCITHPSWFMYHHFYSRLARSAGAAVVSAVLPLAPEHRLPAAVDAAYRALLYLRSLAAGTVAEHPVAERLRKAADFSRVFLMGDSSGGNLVHEVAARAGAAEEGFWDPVRVAGGILLHPGFGAEPGRGGEPADAVHVSGVAGQVPGDGAADGGNEGPPDHVAGGGGCAGGGAAEGAAAAGGGGGGGLVEGSGAGVLRGDEEGGEGGGGCGEPGRGTLFLPPRGVGRLGPGRRESDRGVDRGHQGLCGPSLMDHGISFRDCDLTMVFWHLKSND